MPLSFLGPSRSMPIVRPSCETEWQLVQECSPCITTRLSVCARSRRRQAISGVNFLSSGMMTPFVPSEGISGTSR